MKFAESASGAAQIRATDEAGLHLGTPATAGLRQQEVA
jgi:hypothetical protein